MPIDDRFIFSAHSLQTYMDCQRKFALLFIQKQNWPAAKTMPVQLMEHQIALGNNFHRLVKQYFSDIPLNVLNAFSDKEMMPWLANFEKFIKSLEIDQRQVEFYARMPFLKYHMAAIFDLIAITNAQTIIILDWKTSFSTPDPDKYTQSAQAILYPYIAYEAHKNIFKPAIEIQPENFMMQFWFPQYPDVEIAFNYSMEKHITNREIINGLVNEISRKNMDDFEKTNNHKRCDFCQYRSLCDRGISAADISKEDFQKEIELENLDFDINLIDEIAM